MSSPSVEELAATIAELRTEVARLSATVLDNTQEVVLSEKQAGSDINTSWLILTSTIVFLMQLGFAMVSTPTPVRAIVLRVPPVC